jgi:hypothetical protein
MNFTYIKSINCRIFEENINKILNFNSLNQEDFNEGRNECDA